MRVFVRLWAVGLLGLTACSEPSTPIQLRATGPCGGTRPMGGFELRVRLEAAETVHIVTFEGEDEVARGRAALAE